MKNFLKYPWLLISALLTLFFSCEKEEAMLQNGHDTSSLMSDTRKELFTIGEGISDLYRHPGFRSYLYGQVEKKFDGDYNVLIRDIECNYRGNESLKSGHVQTALAFFNDRKSFPQVFIPFYEELKNKGKINQEDPVILVYDDENETGEYPGYQACLDGKLKPLDFLIDENYARNHEVWVISVNERVDDGGTVVYKAPGPDSFSRMMAAPQTLYNLQAEYLKSTASCAAPPATPTNVQVFPLAPNQLNIEWQGISNALYYKIYREISNSGTFSELVRLDHPQSTYSDNYLTAGTRYRYKIQSFSGDDCYSALTYSTGAYASWRTNDYNEILYQIYITDACWNWCCSWPEGDIELKYRLVKYNKEDKTIEYPMNQLAQKSKSDQKGKWCVYNKELFRWDITRYAYNYMLFVYEDDGGDDEGFTVKLSAKFAPTDGTSIGAEISFTIDDKDEELGWVEIYHYDPRSKVYSLSPRKGSAQLMIRQ